MSNAMDHGPDPGPFDRDAPACDPTSACPPEARSCGTCETLGSRDARILTELAHEGEAEVAFSGLRRRLEIHQQSLTRALGRLAEAGLVEQARRGYRLTESGYEVLAGCPPPRQTQASTTVAQALLPPRLGHGHVARELEERWFSGLRWYGLVEAPDETVLIWLTEPGHRFVRVRLNGGAFSLEVDTDGEPDAPAFQAVHPLLVEIGELYGLDAGSSSVQAFGGDDRSFAA